AGVEEVESVSDTHKKSETNQQVSDFHTTEGSVNGSLTDQHCRKGPYFYPLDDTRHKSMKQLN
ncbi:hypothetical protein, partial [Aeromonas caviae]|uniref:hypothetical protein n=1 Tax=Aeromonas caviae TaxID=648 RepID=UPI001F357553